MGQRRSSQGRFVYNKTTAIGFSTDHSGAEVLVLFDFTWFGGARPQNRFLYFIVSHVTRKPVFGGIRPGKTRAGLLSYRSQRES